MYTITHTKGCRIYSFVAYAAFRGTKNSYTLGENIRYMYGEEGSTGNPGYNNSHGNTTIWSSKFSGKIQNSSGAPVKSTWADATYRYQDCGPFDPPEYLSNWENLTMNAGIPTFNVINSSQFWNDSDPDNANRGVEVKIQVTDYDDKPLKVFDASDVVLYNKSNKPTKVDAVPISSEHLNISVTTNNGYCNITITPRGRVNRWGYNSSATTVWAARGKVYVVISSDRYGNTSKEWNGTAEFSLTSADYQIKWVDDDGSDARLGWASGNSNTDGVIPEVPRANHVPIWIQFKVVASDYSYYGATSGGSTAQKAAENITISGDSLFTGTLDKFPGFTTSWFSSSSGAWTIPIVPLMNVGGGSITISAEAWNRTLTKKLAVGEEEYWKDGVVVAVSPDSFKIDTEDQILSVTVTDGLGNAQYTGYCHLLYINGYDPDNKNPLTPGTVGTTSNVSGGFTADSAGEYTWNFNMTQQTTNQTNTFGSGITNIKAPRNLTVYAVVANRGYGYALIQMKPQNDLEVEMSRTTMLAGQRYDNFYINCTFAGNSTDTPSTESTDRNNFHIRIIDQDGTDVTETFDSSSSMVGSTLTGDSDYSYVFDGVYCTTPGTYTFYAYNNTHDSEGHNWTVVVEQVEVSVDKAPLIWKSDQNLSATFTITYNGQPVNGSLRIDNVSDVGDYNKTWVNCSFDGSNDLSGNTSMEIDWDIITNGVITIHDITPAHMDAGQADQIISFWFMPVDDDGIEGEYARASGQLLVSVPTIAPEQQYIAVGRTTTLDVTVTGRGETLGDIYVRAHGSGVDQNGTSGTIGSDKGIVTFSLLPSSTGNISFDVGAEGRTVETPVIIVTGWILDVSVSPSDVDEGETFTVTVIKEGTSTAVADADVTISGIGTAKTDANGEATFTAPLVTSDRTYDISASAEGYAPDPTPPSVRVINVPQLTISVSNLVDGKIPAGSQFEVTVGKDTGDPVIGATVTMGDQTVKTQAGGVATLTAPTEEDSTVTITASFSTFTDKTETYTIGPATGGVPGFEVLTLLVALGVAFILLRRRRN
jgi:hypothetical protein